MKKLLLILIPILAALAITSYFYFPKAKPTELSTEPYPRLANYYLDWDVPSDRIEQLAKWDVLVLTPQAEERNPGLLKKLKELNPNIKIFVYQLMQESSPAFVDEVNGTYAKNIFDTVTNNDWWLRDTKGDYVSLWPTNRIINITQNNTKWVDYITNFVSTEYFAKHPEYDGVFYDNTWFDISWLPNITVDLNRDGKIDDKAAGDKAWGAATQAIFEKTRATNPGKLIIGNVNFSFFNTYVNGKMFESFGRNQLYTWAQLMNEYWNNTYGFTPNIVLMNENTGNIDNQADYRKMRFGLTSTMLGQGYFTFDIGDCCHHSIWWYDEYDVDLGKATTAPQKLFSIFGITKWLDRPASIGVWKREFEKGIILVNSTNSPQLIELDQNYKKILGTQEPSVNDGSLVRSVTLGAGDGIILLK